jgi:AmmeMemoRadiSam system protein A
MDKNLIENAGECGLRPIIMVMGALDGKQARSEVLSYEAPFGVGYCVCYIEPGEADRDRCLLPRLRAAGVERECSEQSDIVRLARKSLEQYVRSGTRIEPPGDDSWMSKTANACFVSLQKHGRLRGCIGSIEPQNSTLAEEVIENAIAAGTEDPRFMPVTPEELGDLVYSVDVLEPAERVASVSDLDPEVYGVIVEKGKRRGLLLPDLPGITSADEQVRIAREKAGIREAETGVNLYRFRVERYH